MLNFWSQELYIKAYLYAAKAHNNQFVPGSNLPYIVHISLVSMEVMAALARDDRNLDGDLAIQCALLHDVIEDPKKPYDEVCKLFGIDVAGGVDALTKQKGSGTKNEKMIENLKRIKSQPYEVWIVKMADRITNLQPPPANWEMQKKVDYREEARLIYNELKDASEYLAIRLLKKIEEYPINDVG